MSASVRAIGGRDFVQFRSNSDRDPVGTDLLGFTGPLYYSSAADDDEFWRNLYILSCANVFVCVHKQCHDRRQILSLSTVIRTIVNTLNFDHNSVVHVCEYGECTINVCGQCLLLHRVLARHRVDFSDSGRNSTTVRSDRGWIPGRSWLDFGWTDSGRTWSSTGSHLDYSSWIAGKIGLNCSRQ